MSLREFLDGEELGAQPGGDGLFASFSNRAVLSCAPRRQPSQEFFAVRDPNQVVLKADCEDENYRSQEDRKCVAQRHIFYKSVLVNLRKKKMIFISWIRAGGSGISRG